MTPAFPDPQTSPAPPGLADAAIEVVLCSYNGEKYIREQVESVLRQTVKPKRLSIYDDGSTDRTRAIVQEIVGGDTGGVEVVLHANPRNLGYVKNFEQGMRRAACDYIALCDQDDIWEPDKLAVLLTSFDAGTGVVFSDALLVDERAASLGRTLWQALAFTPGKQARFDSPRAARELLVQQNYVTGAALMMRRDLAQRLPPFPVAAAHDYWIAIVASQASRLRPVNRVLYRYRQHSANVIGEAPRRLSHRIVEAFRRADARLGAELHTCEQLALALQGLAGLEPAQEAFGAKVAFLRARVQALAAGWRGFVPLGVMLLAGRYARFCRLGSAMFAKDVCLLLARCLRGARTVRHPR